MTKHVHSVLSQEASAELVGVVWHQGWNDGCSAGMVAEYERNLANLIRDVRSEFAAFGSPYFSIPVSGLDSWRGRVDRRNGIIAAQYAVSTYPAFRLTVAAEETRGFVRFYDETGGACNQGYHFNCNGETYFYVGTVAGQAMSALINRSWVQPYINTTNPEGGAEHGTHVDDGCEVNENSLRSQFGEW
eukprot:CAMPEP_0119307870 /NCGR_PEP_ID=MMETSP1333-20130426/8242_1 /TAXON_ID=418940 /ORGANISM="Scyphosphaera apsteinii, Strain RCC1455" /LENGTH=187 /DNA_ID=CAMNT_0007311507 /DNA_START=22 /DNA_END=582 /DNA_ORIENTATION=-